MAQTATAQSTVVRTERGVSIAGTRITLYSIMDYLKADWPPHLIQHWFNLTEAQMTDVLTYITAHHDEIEAEYQTVVQQAEANRAYWESRNRELRQQIAKLPPNPAMKLLMRSCKPRKPS